MSTQESPQGSTVKNAPPPSSNAARIRSLVLLGILVLLLIALWYDYKVARPNVEKAYDDITALNDEINKQSGRKYMTNQDVQAKLQRTPSDEYDKNGYHVEIYNYQSGLPIRPHKYFAVYTEGSPSIFLKHYKFEMDPAELTSVPLVTVISDGPKDGGMVPPPSMAPPPGAPGGGGRRARPQSADEGSGELAQPLPGSPESNKGKKSEAKSESTSNDAADESPAATKEATPSDEKAKEEKPKEETPQEEKPKDDAPKDDAPKDEKPQEEKPKEEKP